MSNLNKFYLTIDKYEEFLKNNNINRIPFSNNIILVIENIINCIKRSKLGISKIDHNTTDGKYILEYEGLTGIYTRHLYNNLCSNQIFPNVKYLEIGTWYGSSSISAIYKNKLIAFFIDNWCQFGGDSNIFISNIQKFMGESECHLLENDCWTIDLNNLRNIGPFNIYLFDGAHTYNDHYQSLTYYYPVLDDIFIFLVDDWNWPEVRDGTIQAISDLDLHILFRHEEFISSKDLENMPQHNGKNTWWNGIGIFLLSKTSKIYK